MFKALCLMAKHICGCALLLDTIIFLLLQHLHQYFYYYNGGHQKYVVILSTHFIGGTSCCYQLLCAIDCEKMMFGIGNKAMSLLSLYGPPTTSYASKCAMQFNMQTSTSRTTHVGIPVCVRASPPDWTWGMQRQK